MNNYSPIQKLLHRIALSSQFMREAVFEFEESMFCAAGDEIEDNHVFVAGLARSGTTILLNAIHETEEFGSLSYKDMPFVLAPNFWAKISPTRSHGPKRERAHGDGIKVTTSSPEAFEEVFWKTFDNSSMDTEVYFKKYVGLVLKSCGKVRYLSKNNQNIRRLMQLHGYFPGSKILVPFRDPLQQANSLFRQHKKFSEIQGQDLFVRNYMKWIGHSEFGMDYKPIVAGGLQYPDTNDLNHWLEQWLLTYKSVRELPLRDQAFNFICYEALCDRAEVWQSVQSVLEIGRSSDFSFVASRKAEIPPVDQALHAECLELYESLRHLSLGE